MHLLMPTWLIVTKSWQRQSCSRPLSSWCILSLPRCDALVTDSEVSFFAAAQHAMISRCCFDACVSPHNWREGRRGQGIELREVRPRRSGSCQKRSQKSTMGERRPQLFRFWLKGGGAVQKLVHHHHCGKAMGRFIYGNQRVLANFGKLTKLLAHFFRAPFSFKSQLA